MFCPIALRLRMEESVVIFAAYDVWYVEDFYSEDNAREPTPRSNVLRMGKRVDQISIPTLIHNTKWK